MKGLKLFLAACFFVPTMSGAVVGNTKTTQRSTVVRTSQNTTNTRNSATKQRNTKNDATKKVSSRTTQSRNTVQTTKSRSTVLPRNTSSVSRTATNAVTAPRNIKKDTTTSRAARVPTTVSRAATVKTRESVMNRDFSKCKSVFFDCMDEFCANKDAQLKRCACSARTNEFKSTQKSLDAVEDNLLDFSQRLLKVNMDPADAAVINQESEGEAAYNATKDNSAARKTLNEIAKKLNANFDSTGSGESGLSLTWSLDMDSAFDSVDSLGGVATTSKSGTALRNAALPICREMAAEVCDSDDISLVENSYNMAIEQDCNIVKKSYETKTQTARTKVLESGALLDMTRLSTYQDNNSDDALQCRAKMLDMLTNTTVCGSDLMQCLDISGRYINPGTGTAFLTPELVNMSVLITRPTGNSTWASYPNNATFVSYLNSKKKYLKSATQNCQDIADDIWKDFIEDALAKIKLAQEAKLEEVRQSCTTLMSECLVNANANLTEFDSRALTTFGVVADKTANALCENVKTSCANIMAYDTTNSTIQTTTTDWEQGATEVAAIETYHKIIDTCSEVGRGCVINACKSIMGNFGLCESLTDSVNRHNILARAACWPDVMECVNQATPESIQEIRNLLPSTFSPIPEYLYAQIYNNSDIYLNNNLTVNDICVSKCINQNSIECYRCRIAEQIWGHCQHDSAQHDGDNKILIPQDTTQSTILSWFAKNTNTDTNPNSCGISMCPADTYQISVNSMPTCVTADNVIACGDSRISEETILCRTKIDAGNGIANCCPTDQIDSFGNCCMNNVANVTINSDIISSNRLQSKKICTNGSGSPILLWHDTEPSVNYSSQQSSANVTYIFCNGTVGYLQTTNNPDYPTVATCSTGEYIILKCHIEATWNNDAVGTQQAGARYSFSNCYYDNPTPQTNPASVSPTHHYNINYFINQNASSLTANNTNANVDAYCNAVNGGDNCGIQSNPCSPASCNGTNARNVCQIGNSGQWAEQWVGMSNNNTLTSIQQPATHIVDFGRATPCN